MEEEKEGLWFYKTWDFRGKNMNTYTDLSWRYTAPARFGFECRYMPTEKAVFDFCVSFLRGQFRIFILKVGE